ncbi:MAG: hypothetical protein HY043_08465 [Verrucomicrobia bacterium]|nr:hypothetical protein [Verrucomicrobiota bacterium]
MKRLLHSLLLALFTFWGFSACGATAQVHLYCMSVHFDRTDLYVGDQDYFVEFIADLARSPYDGELAPNPVFKTNEVKGFYHFYLPGADIPTRDDLVLGVPLGLDSNNNGVDDFYESAVALDLVTTSGVFEDGTGNGRPAGLFATWSRDAGSDSGVCTMQFDTALGLSTWSVNFRVREFSGTLDYARQGVNAVGLISLADGHGQSLTGQLQVSSAKTNQISMLSGEWNLGNQGVFVTPVSMLDRRGSNYFGKIMLSDGDLTTTYPDYLQWILHITDPNDADHNGIPDLTDRVHQSQSAQLTITRGSSGLALTIEGETGNSYEIQATPVLNSSTWLPVQSVTLTNSIQMLVLPLPTNATAFWRLRSL